MEPQDNQIPSQLVANADRQASDSIRGYGYQIWQSVYAWLELGNDEILVLEGGEDFDTIGNGQATLNQVKDIARNITLRSEDALAAIASFWDLKEKNKRYSIRFRFLTTAQAGVEQGSPFGTGIAGIETWKRAGDGDDDRSLNQLREFLLGEDKLPQPILEFLRTSTIQEIRAGLLKPFEWLIGLEPAEFVEAAVQRKLIVYGEQKDVLAHDAEKVAPALFKAAFDAASRKTKRILYRSDFVKIFDEITTKRISPMEARAVSAAYSASRFFSSESFPILPVSVYSPVSAPPPLPDQLAPRRELVRDLSGILARESSLVLTGGTGMGKSTLANLVISGSPWLWVNLRAEQSDNSRWVLMLLAQQLDSGSDIRRHGIVFDDYLADSIDSNLFGGLLYTLRERGMSFIITTSRSLPSRLSSRLGLGSSLSQVPALNRVEIAGWLADCGCPSALVASLSGFLLAITSGHPQLIHARIKHLEQTGWREPDLNDLVQVPLSVEEVGIEARSLLGDLPEEARLLAYLLSMAAQPFRRDHAVAIGGTSAGIQVPGEPFDLLIGPWIERLAKDYFRVSPLLSNAAREVFPAERLKVFHKDWGEVLWGLNPRTNTEAVGAFFHAYLGGNAKTMIEVAFGLLGSEKVVQEAAAVNLQWFVAIGVDTPMPAFIPETEGRLALRVLQYKMAAEPDRKRRIAIVWDEESQRYPSEERRPVYRFIFLLTVALDREARHSISQLFVWLRGAPSLFMQLRASYPELASSLEERGSSIVKIGSFEEGLFLLIVVQCSSVEDLSSLLSNVESLDDDLRDLVLRLFASSTASATSLVDRCWLAEKEKTRPDWEYCLGVLDRARLLGAAWNCPKLQEAASRARIMISHEILERPDEAFRLLAEESSDLPGSALLVDEGARLLQEQGAHEEALAIWRDSIPRWVESGELEEVTLVYTYRKAAVSAGHLGLWKEAAQYFGESFSRLADYFERHGSAPGENPSLKLAVPEFRADYAFCLSRAGEQEESLENFEAVIATVSDLSSELEDTDRYKFLVKVLATMLLWLRKPAEAVEPFPGAASAEKSAEGILNSPLVEVEILWAMLCRLELKAGTADKILEEARPVLALSNNSLARHFFSLADVGHKIRSGDLKGLLEALSIFVDDLLDAGNAMPSRRVGQLLGILRLSFASFEYHQPGESPPWEEWRSFFKVHYSSESVLIDEWLRMAEDSFQQSPKGLTSVLSSWGSDPRFSFDFPRAAASQSLSPEAIWVAQFYFLSQARSVEEVVSYFASDLVESQWQRLIGTPALLVNPRINVPKIQGACRIEEPGLRKAAAILLAALPSVMISVGEMHSKVLENIRDGLKE